MNQSFSAVIPAAGNSVRMGRDKAMLPFGQGPTFASHLVNCYGAYGCNPIVLVVNEKFDSSSIHAGTFEIIVNRQLEKGRSWSIYLGVNQVPEGSACFIQNIDNPYQEPDLLNELLDRVTPASYSVPTFHGHGGHPILLGSKVVDFLRLQKKSTDFRLVLQRFARIEVPYPNEGILWNINTPGDYIRFMAGNRE